MNTQTTPPPLSDRLAQVANLAAFAEKSGIPLRTLARIKAAGDYSPSTTTTLAVEAALKRLKPKMKASHA